MAKNPNSFQKRQREFDKKRKAEDKRKRRQAQKHAAATGPQPPSTPAAEERQEDAD
jgi:hypothetical protein